ncbi:MAG: mechanosensitive ion channel [Planctomycetes bacterium]|nr:mechanosensitive ion channel [Planctomycetota bacterium]
MLVVLTQEGPTFDITHLVPSAATLTVVLITLVVVRFAMGKMPSSPTKGFRIQITMLTLSLTGLLLVLVSLPLGQEARHDLVSVLGIVLSAAMALASTTFLGNAMAGIQLRVVSAFRSGDFLRVGEHFGRVTERGLFHTEIQTVDRDLTTLPNLFLVSNPYKVVRASGTIISATVSLGYDISRVQVQECLLRAAERAELSEPFVQVEELGDYSVTYRIAGLLTEVKQIPTMRSQLRKRMLDELHDAGIEILSPTYMTTRAIKPTAVVAPEQTEVPHEPDVHAPVAIIFDKAEDAESLLKCEQRVEKIAEEVTAAEARAKAASGEARTTIEREVESLRSEREQLTAEIAVIKERIRLAQDGA